MNKKWRKPNNDCSKNWPVSTISFSSPKPPDRRRFPLRFMESLHAFFVAHWDQEPEIRKLFGIKPSVFRFMESLHAFFVAHWDQEPEIRKLFGIKPSVFRFMESLHAFLARIGTMNPPLTPPRRGTESPRTNACSPPGRGRGWVGSGKASIRFCACIGTMNLTRPNRGMTNDE